MKCPQCQNTDSKVVESRDVANGESIRRRRECLRCSHRYTTYERVERPSLNVVKKDGTRQAYSRSKLILGLERACEKTTISGVEFEHLIARIERQLYDRAEGDVSSEKIGQIVMNELADIDEVAYVRFASVYRSFNDLESFDKELALLRTKLSEKSEKNKQ